jgi:hypothetical protein
MWSPVIAGVILNAAVCSAFVAPAAPFGIANRRPVPSVRSPLRMVASPPLVPPGDSASPAPDPEDPKWKGTSNVDRQLVWPRSSCNCTCQPPNAAHLRILVCVVELSISCVRTVVLTMPETEMIQGSEKISSLALPRACACQQEIGFFVSQLCCQGSQAIPQTTTRACIFALHVGLHPSSCWPKFPWQSFLGCWQASLNMLEEISHERPFETFILTHTGRPPFVISFASRIHA